jgi:tetratricopeptide (TPR) repeat protein
LIGYSGWRRKGEYDNALADSTESIRLNPKNPTAYGNRGTAWFDKREYDKSIADFTEAIRLDPKYAYAYYWRGAAW